VTTVKHQPPVPKIVEHVVTIVVTLPLKILAFVLRIVVIVETELVKQAREKTQSLVKSIVDPILVVTDTVLLENHPKPAQQIVLPRNPTQFKLPSILLV